MNEVVKQALIQALERDRRAAVSKMHKTFFSNFTQGTLLFDRFVAVRCLSAHNSGAVYLCKDRKSNDQLVVLKIIESSELLNDIVGARFRNEMKVSRKVSHPHVIKCASFYQDKDFSAFSMEYMNGGTLADFISKYKIIDPDVTIGILLQLCSALDAIHKAGIIHRDLKPENILINKDGVVKIADFGISIIGDKIQCGEDDSIVGTVNYLSPEYIEHGLYDRRSDIYSLGLIAYEMCTGTQPTEGNSPLEKLTNRVRRDPVAPADITNECPLFLSSIISRTLQRDPNKRYQSPAVIADELSYSAAFVSAALKVSDLSQGIVDLKLLPDD